MVFILCQTNGRKSYSLTVTNFVLFGKIVNKVCSKGQELMHYPINNVTGNKVWLAADYCAVTAYLNNYCL